MSEDPTITEESWELLRYIFSINTLSSNHRNIIVYEDASNPTHHIITAARSCSKPSLYLPFTYKGRPTCILF